MSILLVFILVVVLALYLHWLFRQSKNAQLKHVVVIGGGVLIALFLSGRLHWIAASFGLMVPVTWWGVWVVRSLPQVSRILGFFGIHTGPTKIRTIYLELEVDFARRCITGVVQKGHFAGRNLMELSEGELRALVKEIEGEDSRGSIILKSFIHIRRYQQQSREHYDKRSSEGKKGPASSSGGAFMGGAAPMNVQEAQEILGISSHATRKEIIQAHKRLIQRVHPDREGSSYLSVLINQAKKALLG